MRHHEKRHIGYIAWLGQKTILLEQLWHDDFQPVNKPLERLGSRSQTRDVVAEHEPYPCLRIPVGANDVNRSGHCSHSLFIRIYSATYSDYNESGPSPSGFVMGMPRGHRAPMGR